MLARRRFTSLLSVATLAAPSIARPHETYPAKSIRLIVPWPPGGGVDAFGRIVQAALSEQLGQTVLIDNIGGGSGRIGTQTAARAVGDSYTLLLANDTFAATEALPIAGATALRGAFEPVTLAISGPQGLYTHSKSGILSIEEYAAAARAQPGKLNVGVPGIGSSQHLTSELLLRASGNLRVTHVPYRGGGPLLNDLIAGNIDAAVVTFAAGAEQAKTGQLRPLAVTSARRTPSFPDVPAAGEKVAPGFTQETWMGFLAPKATPLDVRERVHAAIVAVLKDEAVGARLRTLGLLPAGQPAPAFAQLFDNTVRVFADIATERQIAASD
jgi:tripartite-type tricarboxylate transporter receptor subunit TctC